MSSASGLSSAQLSRKAKRQKRHRGKFASELKHAPTASLELDDSNQSEEPKTASHSFNTYILKQGLPIVQRKVDEFNARMEKKGIDGRVDVEVVGKPRKRRGDGRSEVECRFIRSGLFVLGDWKVLGVYDFSAGEEEPLRWGFGDEHEHPESIDRTHCDHCGTHRYRSLAFSLADASGNVQIVGRNCLKDFTGHLPNKVLAYRRELDGLFAGLGDIGQGGDICDTEEFIAAAVAATRWHGFNSVRSTGSRVPTRDVTVGILESDWPVDDPPVTDEDYDRAAEIIEWASQFDPRSEFDQNMKTVASSDAIKRRSYGVAAYLPTAYARYLAKTRAEEVKKAESRVPDEIDGPVRGTVVKFGWQEYGYWTTPKVMVLADDGYVLYGTLPKTGHSAMPGDRVEFEVSSVSRSEKDETFGFFKRPRKWQLLEDEDSGGVDQRD